jgi:2,3-bisphosphoglycerate-dependent phosphoglycerate mutase
MHLYLIRHGQSTNNYLYTIQETARGRSSDPELTSLGLQQAQRLAEYLCGWRECCIPYAAPITHLYTSPMLRAVDTGIVVARTLGLPLTAWKDLHEAGGLYLGDDETEEVVGQPGPDRAAMAQRYPDLVWPPEMGDGPWWNRPTGEPAEEWLPRARRVLYELLRRHPIESQDGVTFFTHARFCNEFLAAVLGLPERAALWFLLCNAAISCIEFRPGWRPALLFLNHTAHLPAEMVTD